MSPFWIGNTSSFMVGFPLSCLFSGWKITPSTKITPSLSEWVTHSVSSKRRNFEKWCVSLEPQGFFVFSFARNLKQPLFNGCFNWITPNLYMPWAPKKYPCSEDYFFLIFLELQTTFVGWVEYRHLSPGFAPHLGQVRINSYLELPAAIGSIWYIYLHLSLIYSKRR